MYLKSLTLKGFKSFAQPTTFAFEPGVTCIVGPNGSGKSNVVDALAWVMGEQGAKTLRGGKMEDVIFAGTSTRGPLGRAEVSLTIDNTDGALPIEYSEVTISRTLFRNGASEYAINGETVPAARRAGAAQRLRVSAARCTSSSGRASSTQVLHATPEDRRGFIEEAAGILKHRRRKEKTLRKLDAMQANLTRLSDLAGEIRRQLKPLGRQAEVAREAATIAAVVRDARARLLADEVVGLRRALDEHGRSEHERHSRAARAAGAARPAPGARSSGSSRRSSATTSTAARSTSFALEQAQEQPALARLARQPAHRAARERRSSTTDAAPSVTRAMIDERDRRARRHSPPPSARRHPASRRAVDATARRSRRARHRRRGDRTPERPRLGARPRALEARGAGRRRRVEARRGARRGAAARERARGVGRNAGARAAAGARRAPKPSADTGEAAETDLDEAYELAQAAVFEAEAEIERMRDELHGREREHGALAARTQALSLALDQKDGSAALVAAGVDGVRGLLAEAMQVRARLRGRHRRRARLARRRRARRRPRRRVPRPRPAPRRGELGRVALALADAGSAARTEPLRRGSMDSPRRRRRHRARGRARPARRGPHRRRPRGGPCRRAGTRRARRARHGDHEGRHRRRAVRAARRVGQQAESHRAHRRARPRRGAPRGGARRDRAQPVRARRAAADPRPVEGAVQARARRAPRVRRPAGPAHRAAQPRARAGRGRRGRLRAAAAGRGQRRGARRRRRARRRRGEGGAREACGRRPRPVLDTSAREGALAALETRPRGRGRGEAAARDGAGAGAGRGGAHPGDGGAVRGRAAGGGRGRAPRGHPPRPARGGDARVADVAARRRSPRSTHRSPRPGSRSAAPRPSARAATRSCRRCAARRRPCASACTPSPKTCTASRCGSTRRSCTWAGSSSAPSPSSASPRTCSSPSTVPIRTIPADDGGRRAEARSSATSSSGAWPRPSASSRSSAA